MRAVVTLMFCLMAAPAMAQSAPFALAPVVEGLDLPLYATAPTGDPRLFIVEQTGKIKVLRDGAIAPEPFLDLSASVSCCGEQGLLGLAFHPEYATNGRFFVNYTDAEGETRVAEFGVSENPDIASPEPVVELLQVAQPYGNHNGGWIDFGPDGWLYVGMGDGGSGGDPEGHGQNPESLLGKMLRIDVDAGTVEIFASGVRNPWRNAFDGDQLYIADVGQNQLEEISVISVNEPGPNLGWNIMEGNVCFLDAGCSQDGLIAPIHVYGRDGGCSITGGYVYRGSAIPALEGRYLFSDFCSGIIESLAYADGAASDVVSYGDSIGVVGNITSFAEDAQGELYVIIQEGAILKLVPAS